MDNSIGRRFKQSHQRRHVLWPPRWSSYALLAPDVGRRRCPARHKISTVGADALSHVGKSLCYRAIDGVRLRVDEAHRYARDQMLECGTPPQGDRAYPQLQPEIYKRTEQQQ